MATGASTPSSRRTSLPVQRCEASERTRQPTGANDPQAEGLASTSNTESRASAADVSRSSDEIRSRTDCRRFAPRPSGLRRRNLRTPPVYGLRARAGSRSWPPWEFARDRRKSARCPRRRDASVAVCPKASARRWRRSASHSAGVAATAFCSAGSAANKIAGERLRLNRKTAMIV